MLDLLVFGVLLLHLHRVQLGKTLQTHSIFRKDSTLLIIGLGLTHFFRGAVARVPFSFCLNYFSSSFSVYPSNRLMHPICYPSFVLSTVLWSSSSYICWPTNQFESNRQHVPHNWSTRARWYSQWRRNCNSVWWLYWRYLDRNFTDPKLCRC